jgi:predicted phosphodiesterase
MAPGKGAYSAFLSRRGRFYFHSVRTRAAALLATLAFLSCQPFKYSPNILEAEIGEPRLNAVNLERIAATANGPRLQGRIAVLSDTHLFYDELKAAVRKMNQDSALDFIIVAGDVTQFGYAEEYLTFKNIMAKARAPVIVAIGNHDLQADGRTLYDRLYGPTDFTFAWRGYEFIFFDDNARGIPDGIPDWGWLDSAMAAAGDSLRVVPVAHAPPYTDQLDSTLSARLVSLYAQNHAVISIGGHTHNWHYGEFYGDGIPYLIADDIGGRNYAIVTLAGGEATVERVYF